MADTHHYKEVVEVSVDTKEAQRALTDFERKSKSVIGLMDKLKKPVQMVMSVKDMATKVINGIMGKVTKLTSAIWNVVIGVVDKATPVIQAIGGAVQGLTSAAGEVVNTLATATAVAGTAMVGFGVSSFEAAASVSEMNATLGALAKANGLAKDTVDETVKGVKNMGIETDVAQQSVAKMIQANLDLSQASKLARVAQDAAVIGQTNSSDALDRLIHGITTQQTDVLMGIGITVDAAAAQENYAKSIGKTTKQLTAAEKSAAMMNAVLKEGDKIAGTYAAAMEEPGKVLRSFPRLFKEIRISVGETMLDAFGPLIMATYKMVGAFEAAVRAGGPLNLLFRAIGDSLGKMMKPVTEAVKGITNWINALDHESVVGFVDALERMAPALIPIIAALAAKGGANLKGLLGPLGMIIPTINPIVAALGAMIVMMPNLRKGIMGVGSALITAFTKDAGAIGLIYDMLIDTFGPEMAAKFQPILQALMDFLHGVQEAGGWVDWLKGKFNDLRATLDPLMSQLRDLVGDVFGGMSKTLPGLIRNIADLGSALFIAFTKDAGAMGNVYDLLYDMFGPEIANAMQPLLQGMMEFLQTVRDAGGWINFLREAFAKLAPGIDQVKDKMHDLVVNVIGTLAKYGPKVVQIVRNLAEAFTLIIGPLITAITTFDGWQDVEKKIGKVVNKLAKLSEIIVKVAQAAAANPEATKNVLKLLAVLDILWKLGPVLLKVFGIIQKLVGILPKLAPIIKMVGGAFSGLGSAVRTVIGWLGKLGPLLAKLGPVIKGVGLAIKGAAMAFLAWPGPIKLVITAVLALVAALIWLWRNNEDFKNWVIGAWETISTGIGAAVEQIKVWIDGLSAKLGEIWGYLKRTWEEAGGELGPFLKLLGEDLLTNLKEGITTAIPLVLEAVQGLWDQVTTKFTELVALAVDWGRDMLTKLIEGIGEKIPDISTIIQTLRETIEAAIQGIIDAALTWGGNIVQSLIAGIDALLPDLGKKAGEMGETIAGAVSGAIGAVKTGGVVAATIPGGRPGGGGETATAEVVPAGLADTGALLPSGYAAINKSGRDEIVLPPGKSPVTVQVGGITINTGSGAASGAALAEEVARQLAPRLQAALAGMT